jgi:hypothetical protein
MLITRSYPDVIALPAEILSVFKIEHINSPHDLLKLYDVLSDADLRLVLNQHKLSRDGQITPIKLICDNVRVRRLAAHPMGHEAFRDYNQIVKVIDKGFAIIMVFGKNGAANANVPILIVEEIVKLCGIDAIRNHSSALSLFVNSRGISYV